MTPHTDSTVDEARAAQESAYREMKQGARHIWSFQTYKQEVHPSGKTLSEVHKLWHVKVVTTFMKAGVPLAKVNHFRELLEENAYSLTDRRGICDLILNEHSRSNVWA